MPKQNTRNDVNSLINSLERIINITSDWVYDRSADARTKVAKLACYLSAILKLKHIQVPHSIDMLTWIVGADDEPFSDLGITPDQVFDDLEIVRKLYYSI